MKRREFIAKSTTALASFAALKANAAPCPPGALAVDAQTPVTTPCAFDEHTDWQNRISGPDVVWHHNFETAAEVNRFRWRNGVGNDPDDVSMPNRCRWASGGFAGGGVLELHHGANEPDPPDWWRPTSPLLAGSNGRSTDDPGASGTITRRSFNPTDGGNQTNNFGEFGYYGHASYHTGSVFDGTEFYFQVRVKRDSARRSAGQPDGGKLFYFANTWQAYSNQQIITENLDTVNGDSTRRNYFSMNRSGGQPLEGDSSLGGQPGTSVGTIGDGTCRFSSGDARLGNCWSWPDDAWVTVLFRVRPGLDEGSDTLVEVFVAELGETAYRRIWSQSTVDLPYSSGHAFGINAILATAYNNFAQGNVIQVAYTDRLTQMILSKGFIPCPTV
jgi:hypothetical protein